MRARHEAKPAASDAERECRGDLVGTDRELFPVRGNSAVKETTDRRLVEKARMRLAAELPAGWRLTVARAPQGASSYIPDALFRIKAPDGSATVLVVEAKTAAARGWEGTVEQLTRASELAKGDPLAVVDYAGPGFRRLCESRDINYIDLTGWIRFPRAS